METAMCLIVNKIEQYHQTTDIETSPMPAMNTLAVKNHHLKQIK